MTLSIHRNLAHEFGHAWAEYWDFLDCFVDLASQEGLRKLEDYLSRKDFSQRAHGEAGENETSNRFRTPSPGMTLRMLRPPHVYDVLLVSHRSSGVLLTVSVWMDFLQGSPKSSATPSQWAPSWTRATTSAWRR